jgi:hypothetical protein
VTNARIIAVCVAAGWAVVGTTTHADDGPAPAFAIRLRVDPSIRPRRIAGDVMAETEAIWAPYGVRFEWAGPDSSPPAVGPVSFDVSLERRFEGPERLMWPPVMGHVVMKPDTPTWRPIHLSFDAIEKVLAERAPTGRASATALVLDHELARALGRVLAHEIGHVLIGAPDHDRAGLMRATLYAEELGVPDTKPFRLTCSSAGRLIGRLRALTDSPTVSPRQAPAFLDLEGISGPGDCFSRGAPSCIAIQPGR